MDEKHSDLESTIHQRNGQIGTINERSSDHWPHRGSLEKDQWAIIFNSFELTRLTIMTMKEVSEHSFFTSGKCTAHF